MAVVLNSSGTEAVEGWSNRKIAGTAILFMLGIVFTAVLLDANDARSYPARRSSLSGDEVAVPTGDLNSLRQRATKIRSELEGYQVDVWPTIGVVSGTEREEPAPWYTNERIRQLRREFVAISSRIRELDTNSIPPPAAEPAEPAEDSEEDSAEDDDVDEDENTPDLPPRTQHSFMPLSGNEEFSRAPPSTQVVQDESSESTPAEADLAPAMVPPEGSAPPGPYLLAVDNWGVQSVIFSTPGLHVIERSPVDWKDGCKYARDWFGVEVNHDRSKFRAVIGNRCSQKHVLGGEEHSKWVDIDSSEQVRLNSTLGGWIDVHTTVLPPTRWALVRVGIAGGRFHDIAVEAGIVEYQVSAVYPTSAECNYPRDYHGIELKDAKLRAITGNRCGEDKSAAGEVHGEWVAIGGHSHAVANRELRTDATVKDLHWQNI